MSRELEKSQAESAFMNRMNDRGSYDKEVYENTAGNWVKIVGMLLLFYLWNAMHWWANFALGICNSQGSTIYNLCAFGSAILVITSMIIFGTQVNKLKLTHEFYTEKISVEKQRQLEAHEREMAKEMGGTKN